MANDLSDVVEVAPHYLYKITNLVNGKIYIGVTKNLKHREGCHLRFSGDRLVNKAVKKYGSDSFSFDVLCVGDEEYIYDLEVKAIRLYDSSATHGHGYNISGGGKGGKGKRGSVASRSDDKPVYVSGWWFPSKRVAIKSLNWKHGLYTSRKSKGLLAEICLVPKRRGPQSPVFVSGFWFTSKKQALISLGWSSSKYNHRKRNNQLGNLIMNKNLKGVKHGE